MLSVLPLDFLTATLDVQHRFDVHLLFWCAQRAVVNHNPFSTRTLCISLQVSSKRTREVFSRCSRLNKC